MQQGYQCPTCGAQVAFGARFCANCGIQLNWPAQQQMQPPPQYQQQVQPPPVYQQRQQSTESSQQGMFVRNTSGQGKLAIIPKEIKGWNWGAFFFGWLWGVSNGVWISLLSAIPFVGIIMVIVLCVKGNEWAWRHKKWDSIEHFKSTQRNWGIAGAVIFVVGLIGCIAYYFGLASLSATPYSLEPPKIEEGWVRLKIQNVGSIDYPSNFLELQSGNYKEIQEKSFLVYDLPSPDFILQQVGLNELKSSAFGEYRRVILHTVYLNPGEEVYRANEKYTMSQQELAEIQNERVNQLRQEYAELKVLGLGDTKIIDPGSVKTVEVNGMFPLVLTLKRQLNDNPVVLVKTYTFFNYDKIHILSFSCRVGDEGECRDIYDKILYSFRIK